MTHPPLEQPGPGLGHPLGRARGGDGLDRVDHLVGIGLQVVVAPRPVAELDVLVVCGADHVEGALLHGETGQVLGHVVHRVTPVPLPVGFGAPVGRSAAAADVITGPVGVQEGLERAPVDRHRDLDTDPGAQRGHHVDRLGERRHHRAPGGIGFGAGVGHDEGDVVALVPPAQLLHQPVVAHLVAVVGREHHQRGRRHPGAVQAVEDPAELVVDLGHVPPVGGAQLSGLVLVDGAAGHVGATPVERVLGELRPAIGETAERRAVVGVVPVVVPLGGAVGRVGPDVADVGEPRPVGVLVGSLVEPAEHLLGDEGGLGVRGVEPGGGPARGVAVGAGIVGSGQVQVVGVGGHVDAPFGEPAGPARLVVLGEHQRGSEAGQHALVVAQPGIVGIAHQVRVDGGVGVAEQGGVVTDGPGLPGDVGEPVAQRGAVAHRSVVHEVQTGVQRCPARTTRRGDRPVVGEADAPGGEPVQVRGANHRMPRGREAVAPPLVDGDEQDVGGGHDGLRGRRHAIPHGTARPRTARASPIVRAMDRQP